MLKVPTAMLEAEFHSHMQWVLTSSKEKFKEQILVPKQFFKQTQRFSTNNAKQLGFILAMAKFVKPSF